MNLISGRITVRGGVLPKTRVLSEVQVLFYREPWSACPPAVDLLPAHHDAVRYNHTALMVRINQVFLSLVNPNVPCSLSFPSHPSHHIDVFT